MTRHMAMAAHGRRSNQSPNARSRSGPDAAGDEPAAQQPLAAEPAEQEEQQVADVDAEEAGDPADPRGELAAADHHPDRDADRSSEISVPATTAATWATTGRSSQPPGVRAGAGPRPAAPGRRRRRAARGRPPATRR
jgi:hypothetical protein